MVPGILGKVATSMLFLRPTDHHHLNWVFDLETLGTDQNSIVTEVSAVAFDLKSGKIAAEKTWFLDIDSQVRLGRTVSGSTIAFWLQAEEAARNKILLASDEHCRKNGFERPTPLGGFLTQLRTFMQTESENWALRTGLDPYPLAWGNGITFDLGKLHSLAGSAGVKVPWHYPHERDARTYCGLAPDVKAAFWDDFQGIQHYGLDDCKHEIRYLVTIYNLVLSFAGLAAGAKAE